MEENCKDCKKWQSHFYWRHMDATNVKFSVKMETSFRRSLNFPRKIAKNFKGEVSKIVKLKVPSGKTWQIGVLRSDDTIALRSGWRDFVTANKIDEKDLLVFKYGGSSSFDVLIFDPSGHEKTILPVIKNEETETETETESESESEYESESETEKTSSDSDTSIRVFIPPEKMKSDSEISSPAARKKRGRDGEGTSRYVRKKENQAPFEKRYHVPSNLELSVVQKNIADKIASATEPGSKLFLKILCSTDLNHYLSIPKDFARQNLEERFQSVSLLLANQERIFPAHYSYNDHIMWLGFGWKQFALGNNLKAGDVCLFEVRKFDDADQLAVIVHVLPRAN